MFREDFWRDITAFASVPFCLVVALIALLLGLYRLFWHLVIGAIIILSIIVLIRTVYYVDRPVKRKYTNYITKIDASSFPSLHSAGIMYLALTFMTSNWLYNSLLIFIALLVGYSRIHLKKHHLADVIVGFFIGLLVFWIMSVVL